MTKKSTPRKTRPHVVKDDGPRPVDVHVGGRLRARRIEMGWTQTKLADAVDLTFQQIQKYERGANRIGASRLFEFSIILGVKVDWFFAGINANCLAVKSVSRLTYPRPDRLTLDINRMLMSIPYNARAAIHHVVKALCAEHANLLQALAIIEARKKKRAA